MDVSYIRNNHLKEILAAEELDEALIFNLTMELRFATLICAGNDINEFSFDYPVFDLDDGTSILPLFTDEQEYDNTNLIMDDLEPVPYTFDQSFALLEDDSVKGIIINPDNENFFISKEIINLVAMSHMTVSSSLDDDSSFACDGNELKVIFDTVSNDSLVEFMNDETNAFDYDGLFNEFSKSMLNTIIVSEGLEESKDDIIHTNPENFSLYTEIDDEGNPWLVLLANKDSYYKLISFHENQSVFYAQLVNPDELAIFALENDYEGIMLYNEDVFIPIPRDILLEKFDSISILCHNPRLNNSINYGLR